MLYISSAILQPVDKTNMFLLLFNTTIWFTETYGLKLGLLINGNGFAPAKL